MLSKTNHADSIYYPRINYYEMTSTDSRVILTHYPTYQQTTDYSCGPAIVLTVLNYFGETNFDELKLMKIMESKPSIGTSLSNMVRFFKDLGWNVQSSLETPQFKDENEFQKFIMKTLSDGKPIMVENVDWGGHWRVIIGYDSIGTEDNFEDDVLILVDPYDVSDHCQDGYVIDSFSKFFSSWFDHNMLPKEESEQPWLVVSPK